MRLVLIRLQDDGKQTLSHLFAYDGLTCAWHGVALEPAWEANRRNISAIPWGRYTAVRRKTPGMGEHWHIQSVTDRSWVLIHAGNRRRDTQGCILPGISIRDIDGDGQLDVASSQQAMKELRAILPERFTLDVVAVA